MRTYAKEPIPATGTGSIFFNCQQQALRYLSLREHNRAELSQKLLAKGYESQVVEAVLASLVEEGSLDEARYVQSFVRSNNKRHPEGKALLLARLCAKGADKAVAKEVLEKMYDEAYTAALVTAAYEKLATKRVGKRVDLREGKARRLLEGESFDGSFGSKHENLKALEIRTRLFKLGFTQADINLADIN
jgi:regulatory protein